MATWLMDTSAVADGFGQDRESSWYTARVLGEVDLLFDVLTGDRNKAVADRFERFAHLDQAAVIFIDIADDVVTVP